MRSQPANVLPRTARLWPSLSTFRRNGHCVIRIRGWPPSAPHTCARPRANSTWRRCKARRPWRTISSTAASQLPALMSPGCRRRPAPRHRPLCPWARPPSPRWPSPPPRLPPRDRLGLGRAGLCRLGSPPRCCDRRNDRTKQFAPFDMDARPSTEDGRFVTMLCCGRARRSAHLG